MRRFLSFSGSLFLLCGIVSACAPTPAPEVSYLAPPPNQALVACAHMLAHGGPPKTQETVQTDLYFCKAGQVGYLNPKAQVADWVVELLTPDRMEKHVPRKGSFKGDRSLPAPYRAADRDYDNSGYARGHLAPADNMRFSILAMAESFHMSNIAPQLGPKFNGSKWKVLEQRIQDWQEPRRVLIVVTGTLYEGQADRLIRNAKKPASQHEATDVLIPTGFYKVIYAPLQQEAIAFLFPHEDLTQNTLDDYLTSVDEVERRSGYDFFSHYSKHKQAKFESKVSELW